MGFPIGDAETAQPPTSAGESETSCEGDCETRPMQDDARSTAQWDSEEVRTTQKVSSPELALAIILAGSYITATPRLQADIIKYLPDYRRRRKELLAKKLDWLVDQYGASVLVTWEATFEAIEARNAGACHFLTLLSVLTGTIFFFQLLMKIVMAYPAQIAFFRRRQLLRTISGAFFAFYSNSPL
ncbi:hypothetical protein RBB50_012904 [Rhinocladiella similis]